jgi:alpha-galactosidase
MRAVAAPFPGTNTSLKSLGFTDVGLDDVWQQCGSYGPLNWTYHNADGYPMVDTARFPNMSALPATAHALGLTAGFYSNNCACADHCTDLKCFLGDVNAIVGWGFDSLKLDGCGKQENIQLWYDLFNWTLSNMEGKKAMLLENCHNGSCRCPPPPPHARTNRTPRSANRRPFFAQARAQGRPLRSPRLAPTRPPAIGALSTCSAAAMTSARSGAASSPTCKPFHRSPPPI